MGTELYVKYPPGYTFGGKRTLNLGCGYSIYRLPNVVNLDAFPNCEPDVVCNLDHGKLPFEDEEFDRIIANHVMEHLEDPYAIFQECARVLKIGGLLEIYVPGPGDSQLGYRDHKHVINDCWFAGTYGTNERKWNAWAVEQRDAKIMQMKCIRKYTVTEKFWWMKWPLWWRGWCAKHLVNTVVEIGYHFQKEAVGR